MSPVFAVAIYFICWWMVFFIVLPFGAKTQDEAGEIEPGSAESAPMEPKLIRKILITTAAATCLFAGIYIVMAYELLTLQDIPFMPHYGGF